MSVIDGGLWYIAQAHAQFPSSYANNFQVMKMCAGFAAAGVPPTLLVAPAKGGDRQDVDPADIWRFYGVRQTFAVQPLPMWYPFMRFRRSVHALAAARYMRGRGGLAYTRSEWAASALAARAVPTVMELHHLSPGPAQRRAFHAARRYPALLAVVVVSEALAADVIAAGVPASKVLVEHDGVDLGLFEPAIGKEVARRDLGWAAATPFFVHLGSLYKGRGIDVVLGAAARLPAARFVFVGGPDDEAERHRRDAASRGLDNVLFTGLLPNNDVPLRLFAADALLMPYTEETSTHKHMSPMKMFEYMAAGRAIVASDHAVLREVLSDDTAVFVPPSNPDALADALHSLIADAARARALGEAARQAVRKYAWRERARRILTFVNDRAALLPPGRAVS